MTKILPTSGLLALLVMTAAASAQPNAPEKKKPDDAAVARSKEAAELLFPLLAADGKKDGYTWQTSRSAGLFHDKAKFYQSFDPGLRHALDRGRKGDGNNWKVEKERREKIAQEKFGRDLHGVFVALVKYKDTRDALLLSDDDVVKLIAAYQDLPRGKRDEVALRRLRQGELKYDKALPDPLPLPKE